MGDSDYANKRKKKRARHFHDGLQRQKDRLKQVEREKEELRNYTWTPTYPDGPPSGWVESKADGSATSSGGSDLVDETTLTDWEQYTRWAREKESADREAAEASRKLQVEANGSQQAQADADAQELNDRAHLLEPGVWCASNGNEHGLERAELSVEIDESQTAEDPTGCDAGAWSTQSTALHPTPPPSPPPVWGGSGWSEDKPGRGWSRYRSPTPPPSPEWVYCRGTSDDECHERIYPGERCLRCYSRRYKHTNGADWEPGEQEEFLRWQRQDKKQCFVQFCAKVAARTAAFAAHQAFGYALEAEGSVARHRFGQDWVSGEHKWISTLSQERREAFVLRKSAHIAAFAAHQAFGYALEAKGCAVSVYNICHEHYLDQFGARAATEIASQLCGGAGIHYKDFAPLFETE